MDTSRLASLVAAADFGSLSEAARQLGARLSTTSRHISDLEADVGEALLIRTGRGVRPTPAGERFIERARSILRELEAAVAEARGERERATTHLRVSAPTEMALSLLPSCVAGFHTRHPGVMLDLHSDARRVSLLEEDFDAAIRLGRLPSSELIARSLGQLQLLLCASPRLASSRLSFKDLTHLPLVSVAGTREQLTGRVRGKDVSLRVQPRIRVNTFTEAAEIAAATDLVVVLPAYTADRFLRTGQLATMVPELTLPTVEVHMLLARRHRETAALKELASLVSEALKQLAGTKTKRRSTGNRARR